MQRNLDLHNTFKSYITTCITLAQDVSNIERRASKEETQQGVGANGGHLCLGQENVIQKLRELEQGSTSRHFLNLSNNAIAD